MDYSFINHGKNAPFLKVIFDRDVYYTGVLYKHYKGNKVVCNPYVFTADSEKDNSRELINAFEGYI